MEYLTIKEVEKLHEQYSLNINKLINEFNENPEKYQLFASTDKQTLIQTIMVTDKQNQVLFMEISKSFITVLDKKSGVEVRIINNEDRLNNETIKEYEVYEIYPNNKDILVDIAASVMEDGKIEYQVIDGEFSCRADDKEDIINAEFSRNFFFEEPEDGEVDDFEGLEMDVFDVDNEKDLLVDDEYEIDEENDDIDEDEMDEDDIDEYDLDENNDEIEQSILEFKFYKNDKKYEIPTDEFDDVVLNIKDISQQIANDVPIRVEEIVRLRNGIKNILKLYKKSRIDDKEQMEK